MYCGTHITQFNPDGTLVGPMTMLVVGGTILPLATSLGTIPRPTKAYLFDVQDQPIRFTFDGTTPSATNGHRMVAGDSDIWPIQWIMVCKMIQEGSAAKVAFTPLA
jgi:hypothetical protein